MTTIPIGAPAPAIDQGAPGSPGNTSGGDVFLALVQGILDAQPALPPLAQPGAGDVVPADAEEQPTDADAVDAAQAASLAGIITSPVITGLTAALVPGLVTPPAAPRASDTATAAPSDELAIGSGSTADAPSVLSTPQTEAPSATAPPAPGPQAAPPDRDSVDGGPADAAATDQQVAAPASSAGSPAPAAASSSPVTGTPTPTVAGVTAATAPTTVGAPTTTSVAPVAHQVFPEVVRLTTSTEGPQRVTIRLNPESLGEVRVVLTERRGTLEVSLSAGSDARRALLEGTPELQRLLDAVGRGDSRIIVRDTTGLPVTAPSPASASGQTGTGTSWSGDLAGGAGRSGADAAPDQGRPHTPGSTNATDGTAASTSTRTTETVTGARSGLDVTM